MIVPQRFEIGLRYAEVDWDGSTAIAPATVPTNSASREIPRRARILLARAQHEAPVRLRPRRDRTSPTTTTGRTRATSTSGAGAFSSRSCSESDPSGSQKGARHSPAARPSFLGFVLSKAGCIAGAFDGDERATLERGFWPAPEQARRPAVRAHAVSRQHTHALLTPPAGCRLSGRGVLAASPGSCRAASCATPHHPSHPRSRCRRASACTADRRAREACPRRSEE